MAAANALLERMSAQQQKEEEAPAPAPAPPPAPVLDDLPIGEIVYYKHRDAGWILVKVLKIDREGAFDGGLTYVIGGAPQLKGAEVETTRDRLRSQWE